MENRGKDGVIEGGRNGKGRGGEYRDKGKEKGGHRGHSDRLSHPS